jgi:hypothetical protein
MATRTSALGRVEAERHQADGLWAYYSFGESLHQKATKHRVVRKKIMLPIRICPSPEKKKGGSLLTCDVEYR